MEMRELAAFLASLDPAGLPPSVREVARLHVLDTLAARTAGLDSDVGRTLARMSGTGAEWEALIGAALAHCHEVDDIFDEPLLCIGGLVVPATLAVARARRASGARVLAAVVAGYEAMGRLGLALRSAGLLGRGWWPSAVCGPFGVAAAAGHILELSPAAMAHALALAVLHTGGLAVGGQDSLLGRNLLYGSVARVGVLAASAAAAGMAGPGHVLSGPRGLASAYGIELDPLQLTQGLAERFMIAHTSLKPYACARQLHGAVEAAIDMVHDGLAPPAIEHAVLEVPTESAFVDRPPVDDEPPPAPAASAQWVIAVALLRRQVLPADLAQASLAAAPLRQLAARIKVRVADSGARPPLSASLRIGAAGSIIGRDVPVPKGGPARPLNSQEVTAKALTLMQPVLGAGAARLVELVGQIEELRDIDELVTLARPATRVTNNPLGA